MLTTVAAAPQTAGAFFCRRRLRLAPFFVVASASVGSVVPSPKFRRDDVQDAFNGQSNVLFAGWGLLDIALLSVPGIALVAIGVKLAKIY